MLSGSMGSLARSREQVKSHRRDDKRERDGDEDTADDRDGQRLQHLRAGAESEGQRKHAASSGYGCHENGPQTALGGLEHGFARSHAGNAEFLIGIEQQDSIFCHDANYHDESHKAGDVEAGLRDEQGKNDAGDR